MKKRKNTRNLAKRLMSSVVALSMAVQLVPNAIMAEAAVSEKTVKSLADLYDGDTDRARAELEALYEAGIIDENANMVELTVLEDGEEVSLDDIAAKINSGEKVGELTVNGHSATKEQVVQMQATKNALEVAKMMAEDVDITDEHVANLQSLVEGISDGSVDINSALETGTLSLSGNKMSLRSLGAPLTATANDTVDESEFPETKTDQGVISVNSDGEYNDKFINNSTYNDNYTFKLGDPATTTYYSDSRYEGIAADGLVTMTVKAYNSSGGEVAATDGNIVVPVGGRVVVTASLNKKQPVPVTFDWTAKGNALKENKSGTVTWNAGTEGDKTFTIQATRADEDYWRGNRAIVINTTDVQGALFDNGKTTWTKTVTASVNDRDKIAEGYYWTDYTTVASSKFSTHDNEDNFGNSSDYYRTYSAPVNCEGEIVEATLVYSSNLCDDQGSVGYHGNCEAYMGLTSDSQGWSKAVQVYKSPALMGGQTWGGITNGTCTGTIYTTPGSQYFTASFQKGDTWTTFHGNTSVSSLKYRSKLPQVVTTYKSVSVPEGTYYTGQVVPITLEFDRYATMRSNNKLLVNGVECPLLDSSNIESKKFTFGYTVKESDTGAINVTGLTGTVYNRADKVMTVDGNFPSDTFDKQDGITLVSDVKGSSLDLNNAKYGINDADPGQQVVTVVIPFKSGADKTWVASEDADCTVKGNPISLPLPGMENATASAFLKSAYFSYDNGKTRYPVYIVNDGMGNEVAALAARFAVPSNETRFLRLDNVNLFMDRTVGIESETTYLDEWSNALRDRKKNYYFDYSEKTDAADAPVLMGAKYTYYAKGGVLFDEDLFVSRGDADYASRMENGWITLDDGNHVWVNDPEYPENRHDVEIIANDDFYNAAVMGARTEDTDREYTLTASFSRRKNFTFTKPSDYSWSSSDTSIATVEKDENGVCHVIPTGKIGEAEITLHVNNGSEEKAFDLPPVKMITLEGKTPFLNISKYSQTRQTLTGADTDIMFASNLTARNAQFGNEETKFTGKLYAAKKTNNEYVATGDALWETELGSTLDETLTHIKIPGEYIDKAGPYVFEVSAKFMGGEIEGETLPEKSFTATATIMAEQAPASISLDTLNSYYVTADNIPEITYTASEDVTQVQYTIQKSGEAVSSRTNATDGKIPFEPTKPESLKEAYVITVYARNNSSSDWSVDSMLLTVYNPDILHQIVADVTAGEIGGTTGGTGEAVDDTTIEMDNHEKVKEYFDDSLDNEETGYMVKTDDLTTLRTDISLQKIVSINYGEAVYGMLSDKMNWESSDPDTVSVDFKQGGIYSDIRNYSYTSYTPATDLLLVGKDETGEGESVTIKATHANTGINSSFNVTTKTLKDQLYLFQFTPAVKTDITYTNGKGVKRTLTTDDNGKLAVYEPDGISSAVQAMGKNDEGETYVGTLFQADILTGERDVASLQLYPCNNFRLRAVSNAELTFLTPDGQLYNGEVTIRGGAYKNGVYCPDAKIRVGSGTAQERNGREDITATVTNGKLKLYFDPTQFKNDPNDALELAAQSGDNITYIFEYRFADSYAPGYATLNAATDLYGSSLPTDSVVYMRNNTAGDTMPQIIHQDLQQYYDGAPNSYTRDIIDYTNNVGISMRFNKAVITTDISLNGDVDLVEKDNKGYSTFKSDNIPHFMLSSLNDQVFTGQLDNQKTEADQIIDLSDLSESTLYLFPFSAVPVARSYYTMTDEDMKKDGMTDEGNNPTTSSAVKAVYVQDNKTIKTETLPFGVSNLSHQKDLSTTDAGAEEIGDEINNELQSKLDIGSIFKSINVNEMLQNGFLFLQKLQTVAGEPPIDMMILPTEDPGTFRIITSIGYNKRKAQTDSNPSLDFDPDHLYDDMESFDKEMEELMKEESGGGDDDGDDDGDGEGSVNINFYGMIVMEAKIGALGDKWGVDFCGGTVGTNFEAKYEWGQNFVIGPVPVNISFEVAGTADLEVSFANKADARALLIDAAVGVSIEAFAGVGFDYSLFALKLGIFGKIGADVNFLYLTKGNQTGTKLDISGEIGIKLKVKVALVDFEKVFASTGFNWTKKYGKYDNIRETWENEGYADLTGLTTSGKPYTMRLMSNGTALVSIDGGSEIENRDYLKSSPRMLRSQTLNLRMSGDGTVVLDDNAYPFSNPALTDDGKMYLYVSDNDNDQKPESVIHFAVKNEEGNYEDKGRVDTSEDNILADTDVAACGTINNGFAAWVKQMDSPDKEMKDKVTNDDVGMMLNATEIYGSYYSDGKWKVERLTDNTVADMAPTIASYGSKAIVAWRSLSASEMPEENGEMDLTEAFNAKNTINYRLFDGTTWKTAKIAYNGSAGTVSSVNTAMASDGTSMIVYTVKTGADVTSSETFYTLIDKNGNVVTTGRLTNDEYSDTSAQVTTVGKQFIVGWYSEHAAGEKSEVSGSDTVVSHDIGLARIDTNGSIDASFPESIGGTSSANIGSDFHFSAPLRNKDLNKLSIVWSQKKDSDKEEDANKQQLNAVRFFDRDGVIGVTSQTTVAETAENYTIDQFDTYTESDGEIKALIVGSDYSNMDNLEVFDTIDLTNLPIELDSENDATESEQVLTILSQEPTTSIKLASGSFADSKIDVEANTDLRELIPGLDLPVQFSVQNTGINTVNDVTVDLGGKTQQFKDLNLLPGQSTLLTVNYAVPEDQVSDVAYTVTADDSGTSSGTLVLNRPDVGISGIKIVREEEKERDLQITLSNISEIPLTNSGKTVKLALYKDMDHKNMIGDEITIDTSKYQDIDNDLYTHQCTVDLEDIIGDAAEVPEEGVRIFARAWVEEENGEDIDELYKYNNDSFTTIKGLLSRYKSQTTMDSSLVEMDDSYDVVVDMRNNSLQQAEVGSIVAEIMDSENNVLKIVEISDDELTLEGEESTTITTNVKASELNGTPEKIVLRSADHIVYLDANTNHGSLEIASATLTNDGKPAGLLPVATRSGSKFDGWFTEPDGGEQVTEDTVLESGSTIYAQFTSLKDEQDFTITMDDYMYDETAHTPTINGTAYGKVTMEYFNADTGDKLDEAPSKTGNYIVKVFADGNFYYSSCERTAEYKIMTYAEAAAADGVKIDLADAVLKDGKKARFVLSTKFTEGWTVDEYGIIYDKTGKITDEEAAKSGLVLGSAYKTAICPNTDESGLAMNITPIDDNTIWAVGYITVTKDGKTATLYTDPKSGKVTELQKYAEIDKNVSITLADAVLKDGKKARFVVKPEFTDDMTIDAYGIIYDKTGKITDAETAKSGLVLGGEYVTKTCPNTDGDVLAMNITPVDDNSIWAVGYITVTYDGVTKTIYTEPKSANVADIRKSIEEDIDKNINVKLADAVLKDGKKARFVVTPEIAEGWTVDAYGIIYDKTGKITDAETAKSGLVLGGEYVTKTCPNTDTTGLAMNLTPVEDNTIWAVGYITVTKDGLTKTIYTDPKSCKVTELQKYAEIDKNVSITLSDATLKDGKKARFVLTPDFTDDVTIDAYGFIYDKTGKITDAETAKSGLVLGSEYVTKTSPNTEREDLAMNLTPVEDNTIWIVGYITATYDGVTKTIYTEPKSAKVSELK